MGEPGTAFIPAINAEPRKRLHKSNQRKALLVPCVRPQRGRWQKRRITELSNQSHPDQRGPPEWPAWLRWVEENNLNHSNVPRSSTPIGLVEFAQQREQAPPMGIVVDNNNPLANHQVSPASQVNANGNGGLEFFRAMDENAQLPPLLEDASSSSHDSGFHELDSSLISQ